MGERTYLEVRITQVYKPGKTGHDPSRKSLALYRFEDLPKLIEILVFLNSISERKVDVDGVIKNIPSLRRFLEG